MRAYRNHDAFRFLEFQRERNTFRFLNSAQEGTDGDEEREVIRHGRGWNTEDMGAGRCVERGGMEW